MFDFSQTESLPEVTNVSYLKPGRYTMILTDVVKKDTNPGKSPGMTCTFTCRSSNPEYNGKICTADFFITEKSLPRLQTLHVGCFGVEAGKTLHTADEVINYFKQAVPQAQPVKMNIGGRIYNNRVINDLGYNNFFLTQKELESYKEGEFEVNSELFQKFITSDVKTIQSEDEFDTINDDDFGAFDED